MKLFIFFLSLTFSLPPALAASAQSSASAGNQESFAEKVCKSFAFIENTYIKNCLQTIHREIQLNHEVQQQISQIQSIKTISGSAIIKKTNAADINMGQASSDLLSNNISASNKTLQAEQISYSEMQTFLSNEQLRQQKNTAEMLKHACSAPSRTICEAENERLAMLQEHFDRQILQLSNTIDSLKQGSISNAQAFKNLDNTVKSIDFRSDDNASVIKDANKSIDGVKALGLKQDSRPSALSNSSNADEITAGVEKIEGKTINLGTGTEGDSELLAGWFGKSAPKIDPQNAPVGSGIAKDGMNTIQRKQEYDKRLMDGESLPPFNEWKQEQIKKQQSQLKADADSDDSYQTAGLFGLGDKKKDPKTVPLGDGAVNKARQDLINAPNRVDYEIEKQPGETFQQFQNRKIKEAQEIQKDSA